MRAHLSNHTGLYRQVFLRWPLLPGSFFVMLAAYLFSDWWFRHYQPASAGLKQFGLPVDGLIGFSPYVLPVYLSSTAFFLLHKPLLATIAPKPTAYRAVNDALIFMTIICCGLFLVFPTRVELRDHALLSLQTGAYAPWITNACQLFFKLGGAASAWPAMLLSHSLLIVLAVSWLRLYAPLKLCLLWVYWLLVAGSALVLKQHYLWDVLAAVLLALVSWSLWLLPRLCACRAESALLAPAGRSL